MSLRSAFPWLVLGAALMAPVVAAAADSDSRAGAAAALQQRLVAVVAAAADTSRGGFVSKDGVPDEAAVELAWRLARDGDADWGARARRTCEWMAVLYDSVGGGLLESERQVHLDHAGFDKRTDSNARRLENLVDAWLDGRSEKDGRWVHRQLDFLDRVLSDGRGGFVAAQTGDRDLVPFANGLAIHAYLYWAAVSGETKWRDFAFKSLDRVWTTSWDPQIGLVQRNSFGDIMAAPRLGDQVEIGRALVLAVHLGGREADLSRAREVADLMLDRFEDKKNGGMRTQALPAKDGSVKKAPRESWGNARAARFLAEVATVAGEPRYRDAAQRLVAVFGSSVTKPGPDCAEWALALRAIERSELPARPEWKVAEPPPARPQVTRWKAIPLNKRSKRGLASS